LMVGKKFLHFLRKI